jgi:hypothetical protein
MTNQLTQEQMIAELQRLREENDKLRSNGNGIKVSEKGAVSVYGFQRFPVTLYAAQWLKLLDKAEVIRKFIADNEHKLAKKQDKATPEEQVA